MRHQRIIPWIGSLTLLGPLWASPVWAVTQSPGPALYQVRATWQDVGATPHFAGLDIRLQKLFVSNLSQGTLTVSNAQSGVKEATIRLGGTLHTVVVDQQNQRVYVTDIQRGLLDVVNPATNRIIARISVGGHPHGLAVSQRLHEAAVSNISLNAVEIINLNTNRVMKTIPVGPNPWGVSINPVTDTIYVANTGINPYAVSPAPTVNPAGDSVTIINGRTLTVEKTVVVGPHPWNVLADPVTDTTYVGVSGAHAVAVLADQRVIQDIGVGQSPHGLALDLAHHQLWVNNSASNTVTLINTQTNTVSQTLPVGVDPQGVTVNPVTQTAYVVNQGSDSVSVVAPVVKEK